MNTLNYIAEKFDLDLNQKSPIEILKINRGIMAQTLYELGFFVGAEIGVAQGDHSKILCENIPGLKLYCVDVWEQYPGYNEYTDRIDRYYTKALEKLTPFRCEFIKKFSVDASKDFHDESLDFVYIDGAHDFLNVALDICHWLPKVKAGGILFGHDFKRSGNPKFYCHVVDVVEAYAYSHKIRPWFILGEKGMRDGFYKEGTRAWMWVKQ